MNPDDLATHLSGFDAVLSALGAPGIHLFKVSLYTDSMKSIVTSMKKNNLKRLLCVTSFYTKREYEIFI
jgi:biliverdin reductase/flavin reductase